MDALPETETPAIRIDGRRLVIDAAEPPAAWQERVWGELLRLEAVRRRLLPEVTTPDVPALSQEDRQVIEQMLESVVYMPDPDALACERYYAAHSARFRQGQRVWLRHILFGVTPGVPVQALARRAEQALLELMAPDVPAGHFDALARSLSNCPSGAQGGDLGWIGPQDCAPELARHLFGQEAGLADGLQPRLVHSRFGLHIMDVLGQCPGEVPSLDQVRERIRRELGLQAHANALRRYLQTLTDTTRVEGLDLDGVIAPARS
ncbi:MAG: peptidylprolyl isomerase [Rhodoferax sp.]|nr:peptidylprolyl isomerase [Rhodoferax sp.]